MPRRLGGDLPQSYRVTAMEMWAPASVGRRRTLLVALVAFLPLSVIKSEGKTLYLTSCIGSDNQLWSFRSGPLYHYTQIRLTSFPDWCLIHDEHALNSSSSNVSAVYSDLCYPPDSDPEVYTSRVWIMNPNNTIEAPYFSDCLAAVSSEHASPNAAPALTLMPCSNLNDTQLADKYAAMGTWYWNETGFIALNSSSAALCLTVNMSSPTPPHPHPQPQVDYNVITAACNKEDKLQRWTGYPLENGTVHHIPNTSYCLTAQNTSDHGLNLVISLCRDSDIMQQFTLNHTTKQMCSVKEMRCTDSTVVSVCCINVSRIPMPPKPGNNIDFRADEVTDSEVWKFDADSQQFMSESLCMTIDKPPLTVYT